MGTTYLNKNVNKSQTLTLILHKFSWQSSFNCVVISEAPSTILFWCIVFFLYAFTWNRMCLVYGNRMEIHNKRHYNPCTNTFELSGFLCFSVLGNSEWIVGKLKKWNGFLKPNSRAAISGCGVAVHRMLLSFMS